jgi:OmcA/MtrC family decaheme c-type cytochrome
VFDGDDAGNLSMLRSYAQGGDFIIGTADAPGQANAVNLSTSNTTCSGTTATTVIPVDDVDATVGRVALQGKPRVINIADPSTTMQVRAKTPTFDWNLGTSDAATPRRAIADSSQCLKCHVGSLYQHGGNRVDNVDMCILCHNSASNEQNVRVGMGVDPSEAYDGKAGQTYEFKSMLHLIHSRGTSGASPIVIYRNRGIYAWAPEGTTLPNWPGTGSQPVYGSDDGTGNPVMQNHNFHSPTYPRLVNDCGACHVSGFDTIPDQATAMATTLEAGEEPWGNQLDDVLQGAGGAACTSCHSSSDAKGHANQNGWTPTTFDDGRQTIIDAAN